MAVYTTAPTLSGGTLYIGLLIENTSDVPTAADSTPTFTFYSGANMAAQASGVSATVTAITGVTGGYVISKDTSGIDRGKYHGVLSYALSAASRKKIIDFVIA